MCSASKVCRSSCARGPFFLNFLFIKMGATNPSRDELKARLREKRKSARSNGKQIAGQMKRDPTLTLMNMGIDDVETLRLAETILKNPTQFAESLHALKKDSKVAATNAKVDAGADEDEEAPPCA